jgi:hypothetical protein
MTQECVPSRFRSSGLHVVVQPREALGGATPVANRSRGWLRTIATLATVLLLPPFVVLAVAPMLLLLAPVALIGIPFIIPAMLSGSLAARSEDLQRASWRPPLQRPLRALTER